MTAFDSKNNETLQTFQRQSKKINKNEKLDLNKEINLIFERKKFIDDICQFRNEN